MSELVLALSLPTSRPGAGRLPGDPAPGNESVSGNTVAAVREGDPASARRWFGGRLAFTTIAPRKETCRRFVGSGYLEWSQGCVQEVLAAGSEAVVPYLRISRISLGPRLRAGAQRRSSPRNEVSMASSNSVFGPASGCPTA